MAGAPEKVVIPTPLGDLPIPDVGDIVGSALPDISGIPQAFGFLFKNYAFPMFIGIILVIVGVAVLLYKPTLDAVGTVSSTVIGGPKKIVTAAKGAVS